MSRSRRRAGYAAKDDTRPGDAVSEKHLRAALKRSESAELLFALGTMLLDQGKFGEALCYFKRVPPTEADIYPLAQRNLERCHAMRRDR